jgi:hypothetical protein
MVHLESFEPKARLLVPQILEQRKKLLYIKGQSSEILIPFFRLYGLAYVTYCRGHFW